MKNLFYFLSVVLIIITGSCNDDSRGKLSTDVVTNPKSASGDEENGLPAIAFEKDIHNFGKLIQGEKATYSFRFKNNGSTDLVISDVRSSCGCTVPKYPREAIKPGEEGKIKVTFDSSGRKGVQNKAVTVVSNCQPNTTVIRIQAQVITP